MPRILTACPQALALAAIREAELAAGRAEEEAATRRVEDDRRRLVHEDRARRGINAVISSFRYEASVTVQHGRADARLSIASSVSTAEEGSTASSVGDLRATFAEVCSLAVHAATGSYNNDAYAKSMLGMGPLSIMDDAEFAHWLRLLDVQLRAATMQTLQLLCAEAEVTARKSTSAVSRTLQVALACTRDVAPPSDAVSVRGRLERAIDAAKNSRPDEADVLLREVVAHEDSLLASSALDARSRSFYALLLTLAHVLDRADSVPAVLATCTRRLHESIVDATWQSCFLDTGNVVAGPLAAVVELLGERHPFAEFLADMLPKPIQPCKVDADEEAWPDEAALRSSRLAEAQADMPVPERMRALRTAAATLAITGAREQAIALLQQAVAVVDAWLGGTDDPQLLGCLCDLYDCIVVAGGDTRAVAERIIAVCSSVSEAYIADGKVESAALLLRSASEEFATAPSSQAASARARELQSTVQPEPGLVRTLATLSEPRIGLSFRRK